MRWIAIALFLAATASIMTGRVAASWLIYFFGALFAAMAAALVFAYVRSRHAGLLIFAMTYFISALAAVTMFEWWPLIMGFGMVWVFRMLGLEPPSEPLPGAGSQATDGDNKS
ncbi:MAG: hypothetical protein FJY56_18960 [Betaproteobacteria bacterium]|nr:hypothetical protein [Betaproteobacteria bacterium]